ncbi:serine kinase [Mucilaginibacter sp. E4BP6]|uniref:serine kinase n=1 Tax=Mucilaginibacter sp. E4BP6 TaxID=2723089 RepID=UPI0015CC594E|nr:serine kinase [Mucilaginibacter sp. E4BP6]NYE68252.1 hypothetical protein [Mucilaginibacter sp. E4BP6]
MNYYRGFGLNIESEIAFPELVPHHFSKPDIAIRRGIVPDEINGDNVVSALNVSINEREYLILITGVAAYYVRNGNEITVQPDAASDDRSVRLFLLDSVISALLLQRNLIPFYASGVHISGGVCLFLGQPGSGKSTLAAALQARGHRVFCDDMCVFGPDNTDNKAWVTPSYPVINLWEDSFDKLGINKPGNELMLRPDFPKYGLSFHSGFTKDPALVKGIIFLEKKNQLEKIQTSRLSTIGVLAELEKNIFRPFQINGTQKRNNYFYALTNLLASCKNIIKIQRPAKRDTIRQIIAFLESEDFFAI